MQDIVKAVAVAGTALPLTTTRGIIVNSLCLQARKVAGDNTGVVFIGVSTLDMGVREILELAPGEYWESPAKWTPFELSDIYIDADNANDGVVGMYA